MLSCYLSKVVDFGANTLSPSDLRQLFLGSKFWKKKKDKKKKKQKKNSLRVNGERRLQKLNRYRSKRPLKKK